MRIRVLGVKYHPHWEIRGVPEQEGDLGACVGGESPQPGEILRRIAVIVVRAGRAVRQRLGLSLAGRALVPCRASWLETAPAMRDRRASSPLNSFAAPHGPSGS